VLIGEARIIIVNAYTNIPLRSKHIRTAGPSPGESTKAKQQGAELEAVYARDIDAPSRKKTHEDGMNTDDEK
jgi:hypothetical protein